MSLPWHSIRSVTSSRGSRFQWNDVSSTIGKDASVEGWWIEGWRRIRSKVTDPGSCVHDDPEIQKSSVAHSCQFVIRSTIHKKKFLQNWEVLIRLVVAHVSNINPFQLWHNHVIAKQALHSDNLGVCINAEYQSCYTNILCSRMSSYSVSNYYMFNMLCIMVILHAVKSRTPRVYVACVCRLRVCRSCTPAVCLPLSCILFVYARAYINLWAQQTYKT